jgi:DNA-binding XRE family transcriptional regulator
MSDKRREAPEPKVLECYVVRNRVREFREERQIGRDRLASEVNISSRQIVRIELGENDTSITNVCALAKYFNVDPFVLFEVKDHWVPLSESRKEQAKVRAIQAARPRRASSRRSRKRQAAHA